MNEVRTVERSTGTTEDDDAGSGALAILATLPGAEVVSVPVAMLVPGRSPRLEGQDAAHISRLAEIEGPLPPILVERQTLRVVDGMHRLMATIMRGDAEIQVRFFDGSPEDAFLHAVHANVAHGYPLSAGDRRSAAAHIIQTHPLMSDRTIAEIAGLGAKTVASIRRSQGGGTQPAARMGRDGRMRPVDSAEGRNRVVEMISKYPQASLRELARCAGVSPATVSDVRRRLERGESPVPRRAGQHGAEAAVQLERTRQEQRVDPSVTLEKLARDPSLRHREEGRELLRLLQQNAQAMPRRNMLAMAVPPHCGQLVGQLAQQYARLWSEFAEELARQARMAG